MPPAYPSQLVIRCDRDLRAALAREAAVAGEGVSSSARRRLRTALGLPDEPPRPKRGAVAEIAEAVHHAGAPARALSRDLAAQSTGSLLAADRRPRR